MLTSIGKKNYRKTLRSSAAALLVSAAISACVAVAPEPTRRAPRQDYPSSPPSSSSSPRSVDPYAVERLRRVMVPLFRGMNQPCRVEQTRVGIINQDEINAANAGNCEFYVTMGLLRRANDDQLRGVLAHELAHQDLGHVAKAQVLGAGLGILAAGLQQLFPGAGALAPIAGELVVRGHSRNEEFSADRHAVGILQRTGHSKDDLVDALSWIRRNSGGGGGGGFLSTHPALDDRIATIQKLR
ncbi:MAG TPA: M48 family metallopeptidase [Candidatus Binatia bacterium]|nr:M48 family metallopeptidase [Candidatus Binatia bacterium]